MNLRSMHCTAEQMLEYDYYHKLQLQHAGTVF